MPESVPQHWYNGEYHIPAKAPIPSQANYSPQNLAWVIEMFAGILHKSPAEIQLRYPNNTEDPYTEDNPDDDIIVSHPGGGNHRQAWIDAHQPKSSEMMRYERFAKKSARLKLYQDNSPAKIQYFQELP